MRASELRSKRAKLPLWAHVGSTGTALVSFAGSDAEAAAGGDDATCGPAGDAQQATTGSNGSEGEIGSDDARTRDDAAKVARVQLEMPRRSLQVTFTCDRCGTRTSRMVNPIAWDRGMVMAMCSGCEEWHKLRDEGGIVDEIRYCDEVPEEEQ